MLGKQLTALGIDRITIRIMIESILESCIRENLFKHFNSHGHNGFLNNVSISLIDKTDGKNPEKRKNYWRRTLKPTRPLDLKLKTKSYQLHIAKYVAYGSRFYGIVWILVRQGPFLD